MKFKINDLVQVVSATCFDYIGTTRVGTYGIVVAAVGEGADVVLTNGRRFWFFNKHLKKATA